MEMKVEKVKENKAKKDEGHYEVKNKKSLYCWTVYAIATA
jgi:hypothetical protein